MKRKTKCLLASFISLTLLFATSTRAAQFSVGQIVSVTENSVNPHEFVNVYDTGLGGTYTVYAGINNLTINTTPVQGFCIDPFHFSFSGTASGYEVVTLDNAPKTPGGPMGNIKAGAISKLWAMAFNPGMSAAQAAALQTAIWEIVGTDSTGISDTDPVGDPIDGFKITASSYNGGLLASQQAIADATSLLAGLATYTGSGAHLLAVTHSVNGQDYVFEVPDSGTTLGLLGVGVLALAFGARKIRAA